MNIALDFHEPGLSQVRVMSVQLQLYTRVYSGESYRDSHRLSLGQPWGFFPCRCFCLDNFLHRERNNSVGVKAERHSLEQYNVLRLVQQSLERLGNPSSRCARWQLRANSVVPLSPSRWHMAGKWSNLIYRLDLWFKYMTENQKLLGGEYFKQALSNM